MNHAENSISDIEGDQSKEYWTTVEQLQEIMVEGRTDDAIMFKKVDKKVLKVQTDRINDSIKYLKSKKHCRNKQFDQGCNCVGGRKDRIKKSKEQEEQ